MRTCTTPIVSLLVAAGLTGGGCGVGTTPEQGSENDLSALWTLPSFSLTDQSGEPFGTEQMQGHVAIVNFIFTRCGSTCPIQTANLVRLQKRLRDDPEWERIRIVSISVDPDYDTPDVLTEYAANAGADPLHWSFLTGSREEIWRLSEKGFKLGVGQEPNMAVGPIFHSERFVLVDPRGGVRGLYNGTSTEALDGLRRDVRRVANEKVEEHGHGE